MHISCAQRAGLGLVESWLVLLGVHLLIRIRSPIGWAEVTRCLVLNFSELSRPFGQRADDALSFVEHTLRSVHLSLEGLVLLPSVSGIQQYILIMSSDLVKFGLLNRVIDIVWHRLRYILFASDSLLRIGVIVPLSFIGVLALILDFWGLPGVIWVSASLEHVIYGFLLIMNHVQFCLVFMAVCVFKSTIPFPQLCFFSRDIWNVMSV